MHLFSKGNAMSLRALGLFGLVVMSGGAQAAGFALIEQNASGLGNAFAGQAAVAQDASTVYFNPAGMSQLSGTQISISGDYVMPSAKFSGTATPLVTSPANMGGDAGKAALLPGLYLATDIAPDLKFGLGIGVPFGMITEYDFPWVGETQAVKSDLQTINVNPSLSWKINDRVSLGFGVNWQRIDAELTSYNLTAGSFARLKGDDDAWGWNVGALFQLDPASRIGLSYRSRVKYTLDGTLSGAAPVVLPAKAAITLPDMASLSYFRTLNPTWDVLADVTWTGWGKFDKLQVTSPNGATTYQFVSEAWKDTMRYSLGVNFHQSSNLLWRFGVAYDETPVPDAAHRTPRIPDESRTWAAIGGQYRLAPSSTIDFGYAHLFVKDAAINHCEPEGCPAGSSVRLTGTYSNSIDIIGVQFNHTF
jgi:long-chain fatty acid transport protein